MNRHERRAAAANKQNNEAIAIKFGHFLPQDPNYGTAVECAICDRSHSASGFAHIKSRIGNTDVPVCDECMKSDTRSRGDALMRKFMDVPNLKINDGGELTPEQIDALVERDPNNMQ